MRPFSEIDRTTITICAIQIYVLLTYCVQSVNSAFVLNCHK